MIAWALVGCRDLPEGSFPLELRPSAHVPSAFRATWDGPSGDAELWAVPIDEVPSGPAPGDPRFADDGPWRLVSERVGQDGAEGLPVALLYPGVWAVRAVVDGEPSDTVRLVVPESSAVAPSPVHGDPRAAGPDPLVVHQYAAKGNREKSAAAVLDAEGRVIWWYPTPDRRVIRAIPANDRRGLFLLLDGPGADDQVVWVSVDGERRVVTPLDDASHDVTENADGTLAYIAYSYAPVGSMPEWPQSRIAADAIAVVPSGDGDAVVTVWDYFDDYVSGPFQACSHVAPGGFLGETVEWTHGNSLITDPDGDGWWLVARYLDAMVAISADGQRKWELGGDHATLTPTTPDATFRHGHASHAWREDDGLHLLMFDNRTHDPSPVSRVVEWRIDPDAGTYELVWSLEQPQGKHIGFLGDARRLANGNTLVDWTSLDKLAVYAPDGRELWGLDAAEPLGRVVPADLVP